MEIDEVPPSIPGGISINQYGLTSFNISWNIAGDDNTEGKASVYEVRISNEAITAENWDLAQKVSLKGFTQNEATVTASVSGLGFEQVGFLAVRARDNVGNASGISESVAFSLPEISEVLANEGDLDLFETKGAEWGIEDVEGNAIISDSPNDSYVNNLETSVVTPSYTADSSLLISVKTRYDIETNYDNAYIEITTDGENWQTIKTLTGKSDWEVLNLSLDDFLEASTSFQLRFRLKDGWLRNKRWMVYR